MLELLHSNIIHRRHCDLATMHRSANVRIACQYTMYSSGFAVL